MIRNLILACSLVLVPAAALGADKSDGFKPMFDGKTLDGWVGNPDLWSVENGVIVGQTTDKNKIRKNTFLATKKTYKNFVLKLAFKLRNGNSGIQLRSKLYDNYVVKGYQADIAEKRYTGILYEEGGRGILADVDTKKIIPHVKKDDWNEYVITVNGKHIKQVLNGYTTIDFTDKPDQGAGEGVIALQLHVGPPMKVRFKDIRIKELP